MKIIRPTHVVPHGNNLEINSAMKSKGDHTMNRLLQTTALATTSCFALLGCGSVACAQSALPIAAASASAAQDDQAGMVKEVVVTAQKREQNLQKVGISVTAVSGAEIQRQGIATSAELADKVPAVDNYSPFGPGANANVVIRGIGLNDFGDGNEAPVTTYIDEFYVVSVPATDFGLFDLSGAQVLRGPQGTLFGRNSTGGLINYTTVKPGFNPSGFVRLSYESFNSVTAEGGADIPINDHWSARLSFLSRHSDGWQRNLNRALGNGFTAGTDAVRAQLRYRGDSGWDVLLKAEYGQTRSNQGYYEEMPGVINPTNGLLYANPAVVDAAGYSELTTAAAPRNIANTEQDSWLRSKGGALLLRAEKHFGNLVFTSVTGYQHADRKLFEDSDGTPNPIVVPSVFPNRGQWGSQEFRLFEDFGDIKLTGGFYGLYAVLHDDPNTSFNIPISSPPPVDPATGLYTGEYFPLSLNANWRQVTKSYSLFGQGEFQLTPKLTFIIGGRATHDHKDFRDADNASLRSCPGGDGAPDSAGVNTNCFLVAEGGSGIANPFSLSYDRTLFSGKIETDYQLAEHAMVYASASRGAKSGGFNNGYYASGLSISDVPYKAETLYAFEVGEKLQLLDRSLQINGDAFYYDYLKYQTFNYEGVGGFLTNHNATAYGAEVEIDYVPIRHLNLHLGASYLHTNIESVAISLPGGGFAVADRQMAFAPHWTVQGSATYTVRLPSDHDLILEGSFDAKTSRFTDNFNNPGAGLEGFVKFNASATYKLTQAVDLQFYIHNIGNRQNEAYSSSSFGPIGIIQFKYAEPRVFGGTVSYRW